MSMMTAVECVRLQYCEHLKDLALILELADTATALVGDQYRVTTISNADQVHS
jgi:hypothetical protein